MPGTPAAPDTTSTTISGKDATADFTWDNGTTIYTLKCIADVMRIREVIPMDNATVFCTEGTSDNEPGTSTLLFEIGGLGKYGGVNSGPLIPAPQNSPVKLIFKGAPDLCQMAMNANFTEASLDKVAGQNARIGARGLNKGAYVLTWDKGA